MDESQRAMLARLVTYLIAGLLVVLAAYLLFAILRIGATLAWWLFIYVVPLILLGWLAMRVWDRLHRRRPES